MRTMAKFFPEEVLFAPTEDCNLRCSHCNIKYRKNSLPARYAEKFLIQARRLGIDRVGFTGGEPFLALDFLCRVVSRTVKERMLFGRIMTNGVWYKTEKALKDSLLRLKSAGYDGSICVSVDTFHKQDLNKAAIFIRTVSLIWNRPDILSLAYIGKAKERKTRTKLIKLAKILNAELSGFGRSCCTMKSKSLFIKIFRIDLSPVGSAGKIRSPWGARWFREDYCQGPGNIFFVMPNGDVKPCCGYANGLKELTIGNIKRDSAKDIMENFRKNRFASAVFSSGLGAIRKRLEQLGVKFPGKAVSHCHFCEYLLTKIPGATLQKCLDRI